MKIKSGSLLVEMSLEEAVALCTLAGDLSTYAMTEHGLTNEQADLISAIHDKLSDVLVSNNRGELE